MSNLGGFRIEIAAMESGGASNPRNGAMIKQLDLIDIGERAGSGSRISSVSGASRDGPPLSPSSLSQQELR